MYNICIVCDASHVLNKVTGKCLSSCPPSHYITYEKTILQQLQGGPKRKTDEDELEEYEDERFETEERIGGHICHPCFDTRLCHTCNGPRAVDCLQCLYGAEMKDNICVEKIIDQGGKTEVHSSLKRTVTWICIFSVISFILLFIVLNMCTRWRRNNSTEARYKSVGTDGDESATDVDDDDFGKTGKVTLNGFSTKPYSTPINGKTNRGYTDVPHEDPLIGV